MADRTDIDALLIGALYGELTPADEARLTAHLESHPADRTALDDLTRTRAAVRESRILAFHAEPPASVSRAADAGSVAARAAPRARRGLVSALRPLVRRAPGDGRRGHRGAGARRRRHAVPARRRPVRSVTAAVRGAAERGHGPARDAEKATAVSAPTAPAAAPERQAASTTSPSEAPTGGGPAGATGAAGSAGYRVDLDEATRAKGAPASAAARDSDPRAQPSDEPSDAIAGRRAGFEVGGKADHADLAKTKAESPARRVVRPRGIEVLRPEPAPKELKERKDSEDDRQFTKERASVSKFSSDRAGAASEQNRAPAADAPAAGAGASPPPPTGRGPGRSGPTCAGRGAGARDSSGRQACSQDAGQRVEQRAGGEPGRAARAAARAEADHEQQQQ